MLEGNVSVSDPRKPSQRRLWITGVPVDTGDMCDNTSMLIGLAQNCGNGYVCVANVHMFMEAKRNGDFLRVMEGAIGIVPDGAPLVWLLKRCGVRSQQRIPGPDLMHEVCKAAEMAGVAVGFLGGTPDTLARMKTYLTQRFPDLLIKYAYSPPFRSLSEREERRIVEECREEGVQVLFVGLGCPKQERWMARNSEYFHGAIVGVGAAFDYHAGKLTRAPRWMQRCGLEWFWRLIQEPRRLIWRYLKTNTLFLLQVFLPVMVRGGDSTHSPSNGAS